MDKSSRTQCRRGQYGAAIRFVQIGSHACHIAHIVTHVIGDGGGVARIVFRDARFHLPHQIGAHISRLGVDTAAHTREKRLCGGSHTERQHRGGDDTEFVGRRQRIGRYHSIEQQVPEGDVEQS